MGLAEARKQFSTMVDEVQHRGAAYVVHRYGKPAAAVVPVEVYRDWLRRREALFNQIRSIQAEADLSPEEAERLAAEAVAAVREGSR